jgi:hypothetical protein
MRTGWPIALIHAFGGALLPREVLLAAYRVTRHRSRPAQKKYRKLQV